MLIYIFASLTSVLVDGGGIHVIQVLRVIAEAYGKEGIFGFNVLQ